MSKVQLYIRITAGIFLICAIVFSPPITRKLFHTKSVDKPTILGVQAFLLICCLGLFYFSYGKGYLLKKSCIFVLSIFLLFELSLRLTISYRIRGDILLYGTPWNTTSVLPLNAVFGKRTIFHAYNQKKNYRKYFPNQKLTDINAQKQSFSLHANSQGFIGDEFEIKKKEGVLRVVMIGASASMGYNNEKNMRMAHHLQNYLKQNINQTQYSSCEVINLSIPRLTSSNIHALFIEEALALKPDVVTFYGGVDDAKSLCIDSSFRNTLKFMGAYFLNFRFIADVFLGKRKNIYAKHDFEQSLKNKRETFVKNLETIHHKCKENNIFLVVIPQQIRSLILKRKESEGVSFLQEVNLVKEKMAKTKLTRYETIFLIYHEMIQAQKKWAEKNNVCYINSIDLLDQKRHFIMTYVHLNPQGNKTIADAIGSQVIVHHKK